MNIESLPPAVLVKIFHYLPLKQQARNAEVSKLFQEISNSAIAETEELIINEDLVAFGLFRGLESFFTDWSPKLRRIIVKWHPDSRYQSGHWKLIIGLLTNQTFPRVIDIQFGPDVTQYRGFELIKRCPNLKFLSYKCDRFVFPEIGCLAKLEKLRIDNYVSVNIDYKYGELSMIRFDENQLISIVKSVPNLKKVTLLACGGSMGTLDELFGICQNLESVEVNWANGDYNLESLSKFWRLSALKNLTLRSSVTSAAFEKLVHSFQHLETLDLSGALEITDDAINALSTLSSLRSLKLWDSGPELFFSAAFDRFSKCEDLTTLQLDVSVTPESFVKVVRSCNKLAYLKLYSIVEVHTPKKAIKILESFSGLSGETLKIRLKQQTILSLGVDGRMGRVGVWETEKVKETLAKLEKKIEVVIVIVG